MAKIINSVIFKVGGATKTSAMIQKSGQVDSYDDGDDGDVQMGRDTGSAIGTNTAFALELENHIFGHRFRWTGTNGGYYDNDGWPVKWLDKTGVATTEALAFPDSIIIDWRTYEEKTGNVLMYSKSATTNVLSGAVVDARSSLAGGFNDWEVANFEQIFSLYDKSRPVVSGYLQRPFDTLSQIGTNTTATSLWGDDPSNIWYFHYGGGYIGRIAKTTSLSFYFARIGNISELTT